MLEYLPEFIQTGILLIAFVASAKISERRICRCETKIETLERDVKPIAGISRAVSKLEGKCEQASREP